MTSDSVVKLVDLVGGSLVTSQHSSDQLSELSQRLIHDDSIVNILLCISVTNVARVTWWRHRYGVRLAIHRLRV